MIYGKIKKNTIILIYSSCVFLCHLDFSFFFNIYRNNFFLLEKWDFSLLKCIKQDKKQQNNIFSTSLLAYPNQHTGKDTRVSHKSQPLVLSEYMHATLLIRIIKYLKGKAKTYRKGTVHVCLEHPNETQTPRQITTMDLKYFKLLVSIKKSREKKN